jgi:hypothetical protein
MTAVEWFAQELNEWRIKNFGMESIIGIPQEVLDKAKEMEKNDTDNKVIHFAEWLTKKHTSTLITLYEHFEEEYYKETFKTNQND